MKLAFLAALLALSTSAHAGVVCNPPLFADANRTIGVPTLALQTGARAWFTASGMNEAEVTSLATQVCRLCGWGRRMMRVEVPTNNSAHYEVTLTAAGQVDDIYWETYVTPVLGNLTCLR